MSGPARCTSQSPRTVLREGWSLCATDALDADVDAVPPESAWFPIPALLPVAAALRALQQWSLDHPARRFDAQDWWYRLEFDVPQAQAVQATVLGFDGLATLAQVWLNDEPLLTSNNMFVAHTCEVGHLLKATGNVLLLRFQALDRQLAKRRPRPRWRAPMVEHQQLRWFRTTLLGRTPGWSPPAALVGPWKDIWLEQRAPVTVQDLALRAELQGTRGLVHCQVQFANPGAQSITSVQLQVSRGTWVHSQALTANPAGFAGQLDVADVAPWWPHTHGEPALYEARLVLRLAGRDQDQVIELQRLGFRTLSLDTAEGNFALRVNGVSIFCRGACWTPLDVVTLRSPATACQAAVVQARQAGMNMLRVTGTMVYEEASFFEACDAQGMLVWQDFMLANMDYPSNDADFMASLQLEARQQLQLWQARPSLAVLCGNSEVEQQAAMWGAPREQWVSVELDGALATLCQTHLPDVPYWPSSAHGGSFPHLGNVGTTSYYGVGAYLRGFDDARRSALKFASECLAFANVPPDSTLQRMPGGLATRAHHASWKARSPRDLGAGWDFDDVRDFYLARVFAVDPAQLRYADHERYLSLSRMATGEAMAAAFTEWRRPGSSCQGALVLFLRDFWPAAGWGLIDDAGLPKACYHALKRSLQPEAVLLTDEGGNGLFAHVLNESPHSQSYTLEIACWRDGDVRVASGVRELTLAAHGAHSLSCLDVLGHFMDLSYAYRFGPMPCDAVVATLCAATGEMVSQTFYFPGGLQARQERTVGLEVQCRMLDARTAEVSVQTGQLAVGVHFQLPGYVADDEYFHLAPGARRSVMLRSTEPRTLAGEVCAINARTLVPLRCS